MLVTREEADAYENEGITRECTRCGRTLSLIHFGFHAHGKFGHQPVCRRCKRGQNEEIRTANPERAQRAILESKAKKPELYRGHQRNWARENPLSHRRHHLRQYGLTVEQVAAMTLDQKGVCKICGEPPTKENGSGTNGIGVQGNSGSALHVDHDHSKNQVRGLLCGHCNRGLGMFKDDPGRLETAAAYLIPMVRDKEICHWPGAVV